MIPIVKVAISLQKPLFDQAESLAQQLNLSPNHLFELALENFIQNYQSQADQVAKTVEQIEQDRKLINQGDIYWIQQREANGAELGYYPHPYVVIQENVLNHSRINTVVVCALTSNLKQANEPGNLLLEIGEANLPKQSAVVVSKVSSVDKAQLGEYIGLLSEERVKQILAGMRFLHRSFFDR